jgi:hypothetical protein
MFAFLLAFALCHAKLSFEALPIDARPSRECVETVLAVSAIGPFSSTLHTYDASYQSAFALDVAIDMLCLRDNTNTWRVTLLRFRFVSKDDRFLGIRSRPRALHVKELGIGVSGRIAPRA